jgi:hypothetical protein
MCTEYSRVKKNRRRRVWPYLGIALLPTAVLTLLAGDEVASATTQTISGHISQCNSGTRTTTFYRSLLSPRSISRRPPRGNPWGRSGSEVGKSESIPGLFLPGVSQPTAESAGSQAGGLSV